MLTYTFTCPDCRREFPVGEDALEATLNAGCPVCGGPVTRRDFTPGSSPA